jgi:hypothetical protein
MAHGWRSRPGRVRAVNEDALLAEPPVFLVADGMGGHYGGRAASGIVVEEFRLLYRTPPVGVDRALAAFLAADARVQVLREYPREIIRAIGARLGENIGYYIFTAFALAYAAGEAYDSETFLLLALAGTVGLIFHAAMYGPQAAFFSELFSTQVRYSGLSVAGQVSSIVAGSLAAIIATALLLEYGSSLPISLYLAGAAVLTAIAVLLSRKTAHSDLTRDPAADRVTVGAGRR